MSVIFRLALPLTFWLAAFSAIYGLHGLLCSSRWEPLLGEWPGRAILIGAAVLAIAAQAALLAALRTPRWGAADQDVRRVILILAAAALVASFWTLLPTAVTSHCLQTP